MIKFAEDCSVERSSPAAEEGFDVPAIQAIIACQLQLAEVIATLTDEQYTRKPVGAVASSVGAHVRHCLDHVSALIAGAERRAIDYDDRQRGTEIETNRFATIAAIRRINEDLLRLNVETLQRTLSLQVSVAPHVSVRVATSLGRELAFVLSHAIHHCSLIAVMAKSMNVSVPTGFGYAPATLAFQEKRRCVR